MTLRETIEQNEKEKTSLHRKELFTKKNSWQKQTLFLKISKQQQFS